jgi:hypothetical protein
MNRRALAAAAALVVLGSGVVAWRASAQTAGTLLWAVGDMARCPNGQSANRAATNVIGTDPSRSILTLGDHVYPNGTPAEFTNCFHPVWGGFKSAMRPTLGNHEYLTEGAAGYFSYFGAVGNWYAWEANGWQLLALDSNCDKLSGGCVATSPQYQWLEAQLRDNPHPCQLAYFHHPRWSQGAHGNTATVGPLYKLLVKYGVELAINGHDHNYQRYAALDGNGAPDPNGVVEIIAGTGGADHTTGTTTNAPAPIVRDSTAFGALSIELGTTTWRTTFVPENGRTFTDTATGTCHGGQSTPPPATTTSVPTTTTTAPAGDTQLPDSTVSQPRPGAAVAAPVAFNGGATDDVAVSKVRTAVRNQATLQWLQPDGSFSATFRLFDAQLSAPNTRATAWSWTWSLPPGSYGLSVRAVDTSGKVETSTPWVTFSVTV